MEKVKRIIGSHLYLVEEIGSTNTELLENADQYSQGSVFCARRQTAGRGRHHRNWRSQAGGLYFSILLKEEKDTMSVYPFILLSALAVVRCIQPCASSGIAIKWPNDVYINHRKVCGILAEASTLGHSANIVIGIGINVNNNVSQLNDLRHPAVSLKECCGKDIDLNELLERLLDELDLLYRDHLNGNFIHHLPELNRLLYAKGQTIELSSGNITRVVTPLSFTENAQLRCMENGKDVTVFLGEM